jgi:hypothetical protein
VKVQDHIEPRWWRRFFIWWVVFAAFYGGIEASSVYMETLRFGASWPLWRILVNEYTGIYALVLLLPLIRWYDGLFPIRPDTWPHALTAHLLATVPFCLLHMAVFVALRKLIHPLFGGHYELGDVSFELIYEYRKVTLGYSLALFSIYAFRHYVLLRRLLEMPEAATETAAIFPPEPAAELPPESAADLPPESAAVFPPEPAADLPRPGTLRFLARRAHRDVLVSAADVHYLEAAGNYVILHTDQGELKLRETLSNLERELAGRDFVRVHRSYLVNLDAIREIQPWFHGDQRIVLRDGTFLNLSRRYRDALRQRTAALRQRTAALSLAAGR